MVGSASAPASVNYNVDLSKRRVNSVLKFFETFTVGDANLKKFIDNKQFIVNQPSTVGEGIVIPQTENGDYGFEVRCTDNISGGTNYGYGYVTDNSQVYSVNAMACRRVRITSISAQIDVPVTPVLPKGDGDKEQEVITIKPIPRIQPNVDVVKKLKEGIGKKILRSLLSECDYFDLIKEQAPMVYASFTEKIKYFNPAFHSITPEGLNARLTFLNQCVRPGETIPIIGTDGKPKYNDSINTAFGAPPILILRIGDFYHTKIVPKSLSITYENNLLDLNPEGIGVQPMMAKITLNFDFIGGMGLAKPIEQLQNALSFNYYANTEIYDERATPTEDTSALDKQIVDKLTANQPSVTVNNVNNVQPNDGGNTIGAIITNIPITNGQSGETSFSTIMDKLLTETRTYIELVVNKLESVFNSYNKGIIYLLCNKIKYSKGDINIGTLQPIEIYGKPNYESELDTAFENVLATIKDGSNVLVTRLTESFGSDSQAIQIFKENLTNYIKNLKSEFSTGLATVVQELTIGQQNYVQILRKLNVVVDKLDGKILESGEPRMYRLSPTTEVSKSTTGNTTNTFDELKEDYKNLINLLSGISSGAGGITGSKFNSLLLKYQIGFNTLYDNGNFPILIGDKKLLDNTDEKIFYMIMARIISDKNKKQAFINTILTDNLKKVKTPVKFSNKFEKLVDSLDKVYSAELKKEENETFKKLRKDKSFKDITEGINNVMYQPKKTRKFTYTTVGTFTDEEKNRIKNLYNGTNGGGDKFDNKSTFN